jgi:glycosyltransferase involved in cell wall biosynthesis
MSGFLKALGRFREKENDFNLKFVGVVSPFQKETILSEIGNPAVEFVGYVDHRNAIKYMLEASALLLIIPDHQINKNIIPGKLFEYIATGKPIICLGPVDCDVAEILNNSGTGQTFDYTDIKSLENYITHLSVSGHLNDNQLITEYSRKSLTKYLISIL